MRLCVATRTASQVFEQEKQKALEGLLTKYSPDFLAEGLAYIQAAAAKTRAFKISIESLSGKARRQRCGLPRSSASLKRGELEQNHLVLMELLEGIGPESVDVVITPECFLDGYVCTEENVTTHTIHEYAIDPSSSKFTEGVAAWAESTQTWVIFGCMRNDATGTYNTSLAFDRAGKLVGQYDKIHCQTHDQKYSHGTSLPVFDSDFGKFGMMICAGRR